MLPPSGYSPPTDALLLRGTACSGRCGEVWLNGWLILLCLVGILIVVSDGLTRPFEEDEVSLSLEPLTYEPFKGALVFAVLTLPLTLIYGRSIHVPDKEVALLWFVMSTAAYAKDFAYVGIPQIKVFITDIVLMSCTVFDMSRLRVAMQSLGRGPRLTIALFFISGVIAASRGVASGQDNMLVLRDFAIVIYSIFLPVGFAFAASWDTVKRFFGFFSLGAAFCSLNALAWFIAQPGQRRYLGYGIYLVVALIVVTLLTVNKVLKRGGWVVATVLFLGLLLFNARAAYFAMAGSFGIVLLIGARLQKRHDLFARLKLGLTLATVFGATILALSYTGLGAAFIDRSEDEVMAAILQPSEDPTSQFRLLAWAEAINRFADHPLFGEGYGTPFTFAIYNDDPRPHNTYLTVLYKMGLAGFIPFVLLLAMFFWRSCRILLSHRYDKQALMVYILSLVVVAQCLNGLFNYIVESPFTASIFWLSIGMGFRMTLMLESGKRTIPEAAVA